MKLTTKYTLILIIVGIAVMSVGCDSRATAPAALSGDLTSYEIEKHYQGDGISCMVLKNYRKDPLAISCVLVPLKTKR